MTENYRKQLPIYDTEFTTIGTATGKWAAFGGAEFSAFEDVLCHTDRTASCPDSCSGESGARRRFSSGSWKAFLTLKL